MQDDQKQAPSGAHQQSMLADAGAADSSPSIPARTAAAWSRTETAPSESTSDPNAKRSDTFERRWEQVQSRFVDQVARAGRGRRRISRQAPVAAAALELVRGEGMSRLPPKPTRRARVTS